MGDISCVHNTSSMGRRQTAGAALCALVVLGTWMSLLSFEGDGSSVYEAEGQGQQLSKVRFQRIHTLKRPHEAKAHHPRRATFHPKHPSKVHSGVHASSQHKPKHPSKVHSGVHASTTPGHSLFVEAPQKAKRQGHRHTGQQLLRDQRQTIDDMIATLAHTTTHKLEKQTATAHKHKKQTAATHKHKTHKHKSSTLLGAGRPNMSVDAADAAEQKEDEWDIVKSAEKAARNEEKTMPVRKHSHRTGKSVDDADAAEQKEDERDIVKSAEKAARNEEKTVPVRKHSHRTGKSVDAADAAEQKEDERDIVKSAEKAARNEEKTVPV